MTPFDTEHMSCLLPAGAVFRWGSLHPPKCSSFIICHQTKCACMPAYVCVCIRIYSCDRSCWFYNLFKPWSKDSVRYKSEPCWEADTQSVLNAQSLALQQYPWLQLAAFYNITSVSAFVLALHGVRSWRTTLSLPLARSLFPKNIPPRWLLFGLLPFHRVFTEDLIVIDLEVGSRPSWGQNVLIW